MAKGHDVIRKNEMEEYVLNVESMDLPVEMW